MTEDQGEIVPKPRLSLVAKYLIFSLLAFLVTGALMHWRMGRAVEKSAFEQEANRANAAARSFVQAQQEIIKGSGSQFDPQVVEAFLKIPEETILSIS